jgi:APA family basic amino acid/polyamine antiporter
VVPILAILGCIYLAAELPGTTWVRFFIWMALGIVVYVAYSRSHSAVSERRAR